MIITFLRNVLFKTILKNESDIEYDEKYLEDLKKLKPKNIVRITGDCPLLDPGLISETVQSFFEQKVDYLNATVDFLDRTIRQITNRTFTIKNAIDWRKFTSGAI